MLVGLVGLGFATASAQTFVYEGVIYKASGSNLTAQKPGTKVTVGEAGPTEYAGDFVIPEKVEYNGKTYKVTSLGNAFKQQGKLTSIVMSSTVTTLNRGAFQYDSLLTKVVLSPNIVTYAGDLFGNCVSLTEITIPGKAKELSSKQFKGCKSLKKVVFEDGTTPLELSAGAFDGADTLTIEEVVINRAIGSKYTAMDSKPFRGAKALKSVTIGGTFTSIPTSYFENATGLKSVTFNNAPTELGTNVFANSGLEEITLPESITTIPASTFQNSGNLRKVTLGSAVTSIQDMAFLNTPLTEINIPATLASIGQMAFQNTKLSGVLVLPEALTSLGQKAFAGNVGFTSVALPASLKSYGDGALMGCNAITKITVGAGCEAFKTDATGALLMTADGTELKAYAPASGLKAITGDFTTVAPYAAYQASALESVDLKSCKTWGDESFRGTGIKSLAVAGNVGRYVAADCANLEELTIAGAEIPFGIALNATKLAKVNLDKTVTTVKQDAFKGCTALKSLDLGTLLSILETDCFAGAGITNLTVAAANPAAMAPGVFTENSGITVTVPVDLVDTYKNAGGWNVLNIVGDANLAGGPADMGMPAGLYYASPDGTLRVHYADGKDDSYDVGGVPHTFQLAQFKNRIYGASAGKKFVYSTTGSVDGDGKLFYISQVGGQIFQAVVLDNAGNNAYKDPFGIYIYGDTLYVNDRNVCIRKIAADAIALPQDYPSWMENNWMGFYNSEWSYGCIKSGWAITQSENDKGEPEPLYWVGMKFNGNGIYRFKQKDIGTAQAAGAKPEKSVFLNQMNPIFTTFYLDEANKQMYIYMEIAGTEDKWTKGGVYRLDLDKLEANPEPATLDEVGILIDGSPVKYEGSSTNEHVGISQFAPDEKGEYLYWCYRAPTAEEAATTESQTYTEARKSGKYHWAQTYDASNPLHQTGIKRVKLGTENPVVEMVVPGAEGYGIIPVNYEGSTKPEGGVEDVIVSNEAPVVSYANGQLTVTETATVSVYNASGALVAHAVLGAGQSMNVSNLEKGVYVAVAGANAVKFVK